MAIDISQGRDTNKCAKNGSWGIISSNSATTLYCNVMSEKESQYFTCSSGDSYELLQVYQAIDQPGEGSGDLIADLVNGDRIPSNTVTHAFSWPHEVVDPIYQWTNIG